MNSYPLIRNRWSNEHLLAVLFFAASLYQLPDWTSSGIAVLRYISIVAAALFLDAAINYVRYAKPVCAVSSAVTAAVLYPVIKALPGWAGLLGIAVALIIGKHIWGGTGKNIFNPAVTAMFVLSIAFQLKLPHFEFSYLLLPAMLLSVPFLLVRVFPGAGLIVGMAAALLFQGNLNAASMTAYGAIFWGCIVITDPATATDKPIVGTVSGFIAGFTTLYFDPSLFTLSAALLIFNGVSYIIGKYNGRARGLSISGLKIKSPFTSDTSDNLIMDLTEKHQCVEVEPDSLTVDEIIERIRENGVFGMGGAGFPTISKLETVIRSGAKDKYFIINGMECDPGLIHDKWLVRNHLKEICKGIAAIRKIAAFSRTLYITKDGSGLSLPDNVELHQLEDRYPFGAEKIFIEKLLGIRIPDESNPAQYGILVLNIQTVYAVYEAVCCNKQIDTRYITVADMFSGVNRIAKVKLGECIADIVDNTVGSRGITFVGGGIMQVHAAEEEEVVDKKTNFIAVGMLPKYKESLQCINCGLCRLCCPMGLNVKKIAEALEKGRMLEAQTYNASKCISCGTCSYVCLAGKNLSARISSK